MKHFRKFLAMCVAVVMTTAVSVGAAHTVPEDIYPGTTYFRGTLETGCYGMQYFYLPYPITSNYFNNYKLGELVNGKYYHDYFYRYVEWYDAITTYYGGASSAKFEQALAYLWASSHNADSPEVWPQEYLDILEADISNYKSMVSPLATDDDPGLSQFRVDNYTIDDGVLLVDCSADYSIDYSTKYEFSSNFEYLFHVLVDNEFEVTAYVAVTDKTTGDLVYFKPGYGSDGYTFKLTTDYKYGVERTIDYTYFEETGSTLDGVLGCKPSEIQGNFRGTNTATAKFELPDFFDSSKYDISVYFRKPGYEDMVMLDYGINSNTYYFESYSYGEYYTPCRLPDTEDIPEVVPEIIPGDIDGDGEVTVVDIATLARYLSGGEIEITDAADITGDGKVITNDLNTLKRILLGGEL